MKNDFIEQLKAECQQVPVTLSEDQIEQFYRYYELLIEWNEHMNLTAITKEEEVVTKHFVDSLLLAKAMPSVKEKSYKVIDVGTGAGFPGIPLKIAFPELEITLLDSLNKRVGFLNEVISQLGLKNISAVHGRAEDYGRDGKYREQYDLCVSRAVANLSTLSEYCLPFVKTGGSFVPYKSGKIEEELEAARNAVKKVGGECGELVTLTLPGIEEVERTFVPIKKVAATPKKYPRKAGTPSKEPIR